MNHITTIQTQLGVAVRIESADELSMDAVESIRRGVDEGVRDFFAHITYDAIRRTVGAPGRHEVVDEAECRRVVSPQLVTDESVYAAPVFWTMPQGRSD
jgi:hypothetical protein